MRLILKASGIQLGLVALLEASARACPLCDRASGSGDGLFSILAVAGTMFLGFRGLSRALERRRSAVTDAGRPR